MVGPAGWPSRAFGRGDDTVGDPHRAHISQFELFELIPLLKFDKQFSVEQFEASRAIRGSSTLPPLWNLQPFSGILFSLFLGLVFCRIWKLAPDMFKAADDGSHDCQRTSDSLSQANRSDSRHSVSEVSSRMTAALSQRSLKPHDGRWQSQTNIKRNKPNQARNSTNKETANDDRLRWWAQELSAISCVVLQ